MYNDNKTKYDRLASKVYADKFEVLYLISSIILTTMFYVLLKLTF